MHTFPELIKKIRKESGLTQPDFAAKVGVSSALIAMIETGQKEVSKNFIVKLAQALDVHPTSITPFLFYDGTDLSQLTGIEKKLVEQGSKLQTILIEKKAKLLQNGR